MFTDKLKKTFKIIDKDSTVRQIMDMVGETDIGNALVKCAGLGSLIAVEKLIEAGADVNHRYRN